MGLRPDCDGCYLWAFAQKHATHLESMSEHHSLAYRSFLGFSMSACLPSPQAHRTKDALISGLSILLRLSLWCFELSQFPCLVYMSSEHSEA